MLLNVHGKLLDFEVMTFFLLLHVIYNFYLKLLLIFFFFFFYELNTAVISWLHTLLDQRNCKYIFSFSVINILYHIEPQSSFFTITLWFLDNMDGSCMVIMAILDPTNLMWANHKFGLCWVHGFIKLGIGFDNLISKSIQLCKKNWNNA